MIYLFKTTIPLKETATAATIRNQLKEHFTISPHQDYFTIVRDRVIGNRGLLRMFFPILVSKITTKERFLTCRTKPDGFATFMFFMCLGALLVEVLLDRATHPREYPALLPIGLFVWYLISILIETFRIRKLLVDTQ
ncbi:MAG: hypothetical protein ACRBFS_15565 [Aureispira sp.]